MVRLHARCLAGIGKFEDVTLPPFHNGNASVPTLAWEGVGDLRSACSRVLL